MPDAGDVFTSGGAVSPPVASPSPVSLQWLIGLRLVVVSTLFLGVLIIQFYTRQILPIRDLYALILTAYGLSLVYLMLHIQGVPERLQTVLQLAGDIALVTLFVYFTGGATSPFSFLYLTVIMVAAVLLRGGGLIFAGLSAISYGILVDLMVFELVPLPANLGGVRVPLSTSRVLYQLMIHIAGFVLVALLVSYLTESLRTAKSSLEEERERSSRLLALTHHVVRSVGSGILAADLDGKVLHLNPAGQRILGVPDSESLVGHDLEDVMPLSDRRWDDTLAHVDARPSARFETRRGPGKARLGLSVGPLTDESGTLVGYIVNFQDLSEVELEMDRQRLQERMAAIGEMAARMAHEIRNPLASISGSAQMLAANDQREASSSRLLDIVVDESRRLSGILDGFLAYARPRTAAHGPVDLAAMLRDCLKLLERSDERRPEHRLTVDLPDELKVIGDDELLRQVFWNLTRNALQAMPDGGELAIRGTCTGDRVILVWRDTGVGMSDNVRSRAFEPFVTTRSKGSGLGLAVVYAAVQEHGGHVTIDSRTGHGTTVMVELPVEGGEEAR
jgi:two-component system sensor histidine kinase PilS (NtrC family)